MAIQGAINRLIGTAGAAAALSSKLKDVKEETPAVKKPAEAGVDAKMAAKARRIAQQKIKAIYANKELSDKAKTRRMGVALKELDTSLGGNK